MLDAAKMKIRHEFAKNRSEKDPEKIEELLKSAVEADEVLRRLVVQGVQTEHGTYRLKITENTELEDNAPLPCKK